MSHFEPSFLEKPFTKEENNDLVIKSLPPDEAPSLDAFNNGFLENY